jgi:hypothetical protein
MKEMRSLARLNSDAEQKAIFENFHKKLDKLLKIDRENVILEYFDLRAWITSKLTGVSFENAIKDRE